MTGREPQRNLLDELAAGAPEERMRSRFDELLADPPGAFARPAAWLGWAAAAAAMIALVLVVRTHEPGPADENGPARAVLALLASPSPFERLHGVNVAGELLADRPSLITELMARLEQDESVNIRLAALDVLLAPSHPAPRPERLVEALLAQDTAIVQAHLGHRMRRRRLLSSAELEQIMERPELLAPVREALIGKEES